MKQIYSFATFICGFICLGQAGPPNYNTPISFTPRDSLYFNGSWNVNTDVYTFPTLALTDPTMGTMGHYMASFSPGGVLTIMPKSVGYYMGLKVDKTTTINGQALNGNLTGIGIELPSQTGQSGKVLSTNGTTASWTAMGSRTINNNVARSLNSSYTISSTRDAQVSYSVSLSVTNPLLAGSSTASAFLEYSTDGGTTWITVAQAVNQSSVGLSVTVAITLPNTQVLSGVIPANALARIRSTTVGTASVTFARAQEVML